MFRIRKQYGAFFCKVGENDFHKNVACLIVIGKTDDVTVIDKSGTRHTGRTLLIKPLVEHIVLSSSPAWNIFLAPYSAFAVRLKKFANDMGISTPPSNALPFHSEMPDQEVFDILDRVMIESNHEIDPRLAAVLKDLDNAGPKESLAQIAKQHDLSSSRLRVIAKEQIGVSLSAILVWQKLIKSMKALSVGSTLSEAAQIGGFSDQAHFTRTIRTMFGTTPSNTLPAFHYEK